MGRTLPTSRMMLKRLATEWSYFSEVLSWEEQRLDAWLWQAAERHASAIGHVARIAPMEAVHHAMLVEVLKEHRRLAERVRRLEEKQAVEGSLPPSGSGSEGPEGSQGPQ